MVTVVEILTFCLPSGCIGAALSWFVNHKRNKANELKSVEYAYRSLYLSLKSEVSALNNEVLMLKSQLRSAAQCKHFNDSCPLNVS